jgi:hypothetical protein
MRQASREERESGSEQFSQVGDDQSMDDSSRSYGESNGDTFGEESEMPRYDRGSGRERYGSAGAD